MHRPPRDVPRVQWGACLEELARERVNAPTFLEITPSGGERLMSEHGLLLRDLTYDARHDVFEVTVFNPAIRCEPVFQHVVERPARLLVDSPAGVIPTAVIVEDREGVRTTLTVPIVASFSG